MKRLRKQRTIACVDTLKELMSSTLGGHVKGPGDVSAWVKSHCALHKTPESRWALGVWESLSRLLEPGGETTQIVQHDNDAAVQEVSSSSIATTTTTVVPTALQPPSDSMRVMMDAFNRRWHRSSRPTGPDLVWSLPRTHDVSSPGFDRNDWYLTNSSDLASVLAAPACMENNLSVVVLKQGKFPRYVTWCLRKEIPTLCMQVQMGRVVLNSGSNGMCLTEMDILDEDLGTLIERDVYSVLVLLEWYANFYNTRQPAGFNLKETVHPSHRSLKLLGGDRQAVYAYNDWKCAVAETKRLCTSLDTLVSDVRTSVDVLLANIRDTALDPLVLDAMRDVCDEKHASVASCMKQLMHCGERVQETVAVLRRAMARVTASHVLNSLPTPPVVEQVYQELGSLNVDAMIECARGCVERSTTYSETQTAMADLGLCASVTLSRKAVKKAFREQVLIAHPDKNKGTCAGALPQHLVQARDILLARLKDLK